MRFKIAQIDEIKPGQGKSIQLNGKAIALFNVKGYYYAIDDSCSHMGAPLANGMLAGKSVTCEWHGASFDLASGEALNSPARGNITAYKVFVDGQNLEIEID